MTKEKTINEVAAINSLLARKSNNLKELPLKKLFILCLASVPDYHEELKNNTIIINKKELFEFIGIDPNEYHDAYKDYRNWFNRLIESTKFEFGPNESFVSGFMFYHVDARGSSYKVKVNDAFLPALSQLKGNFTKLLTRDMISFKSNHSHALYQFLMSFSDRKEVDFTTKQLKNLFGLSENDYMRKNGSFDRKNFEKKTIETALNEINDKGKSITIFKQLDSKGKTALYRKSYKKDKNGNETRFVDKYVIRYMVTDPHEVVNREKQYHKPDIVDVEKENPRSVRRNKRIKVVGIDQKKIEEINKKIYNWLE